MCFVFLVRVHFFVDISMCVRCKLEISTRDLNFFNQVKNCGSFYKKRRRHGTKYYQRKTEKKQILAMEVVEPKRSVKDEKRVECNGAEDEGGEAAGKIGSMKPVQENNNSKPSSPSQRDSSIIKQEDKIESAKAEMGEVREENERLKTTLARIVKEYQSLQLQFYNIVHEQEQAKKSSETTTTSTDQEMEESELVSLSLGTTTSGQKKEEKIVGSSSKSKEEEQLKEGLTLGLDCKFEASTSGAYETPCNPSPENSFEEPKEEEVGEAWPPSKILKTLRSGDDEVSQQTSVKKARVSVRARCDTPTMNDGCQWRKYGQKIAKGNPCPRAYYRCTVAPGCPVRKQVQRCAEDMSILITTYEGNHNHPLPVSATAMASTTAAAASMLMSGSSTSQQTFGGFGTNTTSANLHGLNFSISDNSRSRQFYLPNPSISPSPSYPTITLDLTSPPTSSSQPSQFNRFSSSFSSAPRYYSSTNFNFSSSDSSTVPTSWGSGYLSYGSQAYKPNQIGPLNLGKQSQEQFYQSYLQKNNPVPPQQSLTDSIAAATKAITSDPSFRSALAAAITSIVGNGSVPGNQGGVENVGQNLKWVEPIQAIPPYSSSSNGNCAPSYLNRSSSSNHQQGNLIFLSSSLPFSSKSTSAPSPVDNREHIN